MEMEVVMWEAFDNAGIIIEKEKIMNKFKAILKGNWKGMIVLFFLVSIISFVSINTVEKNEEEEKSQLIKAKAFNFDIRTYNYLGDGTTSVYDATPTWNDEIMLRDFLQKLNDDDMEILESRWKDWDNKSKIEWITRNVTVKRYTTSTMYLVQYKTEVTEDNIEEIKVASDKMLEAYVEYAAELVRLTDEKIEHKVVKDIEYNEEILTQSESEVNVLLRLAISIVLGGLVAITYFGVKVISYENKRNKYSN